MTVSPVRSRIGPLFATILCMAIAGGAVVAARYWFSRERPVPPSTRPAAAAKGPLFAETAAASRSAAPAAGSAAAAPPAVHAAPAFPDDAIEGAYHVRPGMDIQAALDRAAADPVNKLVRVYPGVYRPQHHAQAFIYFQARHDGIALEAAGDVVLSAANPEIADPAVESFPAVVNHVVYFGDGISRKTVLRGFEITGARHFVTRSDEPVAIQPEVHAPELRERNYVFYADGGGIKIWGRSYPHIDRVHVRDNYASPCAGGISIDNRGFADDAPLITNSVFRDNRSQITGSAIDLFGSGNAVEIRNCLFVGNVANRGLNFFVFPNEGFHERHGSGALTVFPGSRATLDRCTFTGNYNGVDDASAGNAYANCIFWNNDLRGGIAPGGRYEIDILDASGVSNCRLGGGTIHDLRGTLDANQNRLNAPDPQFDEDYRPRAPEYEGVGYRPVDE